MSANIICSICFENYHSADEVVSTTCGHIFHKNCLQDWTECSPTCPQCRKQCNSTKKIFPQYAETSGKCSESLKLKEDLEKYKKSIKTIQENLFVTENIYADLMQRFDLLRMQRDEHSKKNQNFQKNIQNMKQQAAKEKNTLSSVQNELEHFRSNEANSRASLKSLEDELINLGQQFNVKLTFNYPNPKDELRVQINNLIKNVSFMAQVYEMDLQENYGNNRQRKNQRYQQQQQQEYYDQYDDDDGSSEQNYSMQQNNYCNQPPPNHYRQQQYRNNPNGGGNMSWNNKRQQKRRNYYGRN